MALNIGIACVGIAWLAALFVALQLATTTPQRIGIAVWGGLVAAGIGLVAMRTGSLGFTWLRSESLRSDAIAIGVIVPTVAVLGSLVAARAHRTTWGQIALAVVGLAALSAGIAAFAIARSGWYWEFVAIILGGATLLTLGLTGASAPLAGPNRRIVLGTAGLCGLFTTVGGLGMLLAWRSMGVAG